MLSKILASVNQFPSQKNAENGTVFCTFFRQKNGDPHESPVLSIEHQERETGIEPATFSLARRCSTAEPLAHILAVLLTTESILSQGFSSVNMKNKNLSYLSYL